MLLASLAFAATAAAATTCTYETWDWDTVARKSVNHRRVVKSRAQLTRDELGTTPGCSVCEEDQEEVRVGELTPIKVCRLHREAIERALRQALASGFRIDSAIGYRVGKSKGPIDSKGLRTEFSNHSYGTAVDINSEKNGLYDSCVRFGPACKLVRGGPYRPEVSGSIVPGNPLYRAMREAGFRWGGEIQGKQKDFMHFSLTGM